MAETRDVVERLRGEFVKDAIGALGTQAADEIERLREKNGELNRRCQRMESGVIRKADKHGASLGRALANSSAEAYKARAERAEAALKRLYDEQLWSKSQETYDAAMKQAESTLAAYTEGEG